MIIRIFDILYNLCGDQFTPIRSNCFVFTFYGHFYLYKAIFSKSVHYLLNQILIFNQRIRIIRHLGFYQANEINTKAASEWRLDVFTHCLVQDMNAFNLQLQIHK